MKTFQDVEDAIREHNAKVEALVAVAKQLSDEGAVLESRAHAFGILKRRIRQMLATFEFKAHIPEEMATAPTSSQVKRVEASIRHDPTCPTLAPVNPGPCNCA